MSRGRLRLDSVAIRVRNGARISKIVRRVIGVYLTKAVNNNEHTPTTIISIGITAIPIPDSIAIAMKEIIEKLFDDRRVVTLLV